jgi:sugar phosphate isomerase/epimerase
MTEPLWSLNSGTLVGPFVERVAAIAEAGFAAATLWHSDLFPLFDDPDGSIVAFRDSGLKLSAYQLLRDYEGMPEATRRRKLEIARQQIGQLKLVGGDMLVLGSTMAPADKDDWKGAVAAIRALGDLAKSEGVRIGYEPMCFSEWINDYRLGWKLIRDAGHPNVGMVLDAAHIFLPGHPIDAIADIPGDRIFLVELNDFAASRLPIREQLRNYRLFPGEGVLPLRDFVDRVLATGYRGHFAVEVFNATYRTMDPRAVAKRAHASMRALFGTA